MEKIIRGLTALALILTCMVGCFLRDKGFSYDDERTLTGIAGMLILGLFYSPFYILYKIEERKYYKKKNDKETKR